MPVDDDVPDSQLQQLLDRYEELREQGANVDPEEICKDCPERLEDFRRELRRLEPVQRLLRQETPERERPVGDERPEIPGYEVLGELGRGGFGVVYKARQAGLNRLVALKMILAGEHADTHQRRRFLGEAKAVARLHHPNVVQIYEVGEHQGQAFLALEYVDGPTLAAHCDNKPQPPAWCAEVVEVLARAVHHVHEKGIVHRDLKPGNVMLAGGTVLKVMDFGLARQVEVGDGQTLTGAVMGTPNFMAPEQASGRSKQVGPAADVWALGAVLYDLLTGRPPFLGTTTFETLQAVVHQDPVSPRQFQPKVPRDLETICLRCLQKDVNKRYLSAAAVADDLRRFRDGEPIAARPVGALERCHRWARRNPAVAGLLSAVALLLLLGTTVASALAVWALVEKHKADEALVAETAANQAKAEALGRERDAKQEAQDRERDAKAALVKEQKALADLEAFHSQLARSFCDIGNREFQRGYASDGLSWMLRAYELAPRDDPLRESYRHLVAGQARFLDRRLPHDSQVSAVAFSPDGRLALTAGDITSADVRLWEVATGKHIASLRQSGVTDLAFSPDGKYILTAGHSEQPGIAEEGRLWDAATRAPVGEPLRHAAAVRAVAFSPDGKLALTGGWDDTARLWEVPTGKPVAVLRHDDWVEAVAFSPDGRFALTGAGSLGKAEGEARLWEVSTGKRVATLPHKGKVITLAFSPDGKLAFVGGSEVENVAEARLWDVATGKPFGEPLLHENSVNAVAFRPNGRYLLTGSSDKMARLWEIPTGKEVAARGHKGEVLAVAFSPDGKLALTAGGAIGGEGEAQLWDLMTGERFVLRHEAPVQAAAFSPDGRMVLSGGGHFFQRGEARLWEIPGSKELSSLPHKTFVNAVAFSPDGRRVLTGGWDKMARLWDVDTDKEIAVFSHQAQVNAVAFSPDAKLAVIGVGSEEQARGEVWLWDLATRKPVGEPFRHEKGVNAVAFSPDGRLVLTGSDDQTARLWEVATGKEVANLPHKDKVRAVAFSPDGRLVLTGSYDHAARLWEVATGKPLGGSLLHEGSVNAVAFSPNGRLVLTGSSDRTARLWAVASGKEVVNLPHKREVNAVAFSPDGRLVLVGGSSLRDAVGGVPEEARLWEAATGKEIAVFSRQSVVRAVAFSPDGRLALTGGSSEDWTGDGAVRLWDVFVPLPPEDPARLRAWVEVRTARGFDDRGVLKDLSPDEWLQRCQKLEASGGDWQPAAEPRRWHRTQAADAEAQGYWFGARFHLDGLLKDEPENLELVVRRGVARMRLRQWAQAVADFGKALDRNPDDVAVRIERAACRAELGEWGQAVADLVRVLEQDPTNRRALSHLAVAHLGKGDLPAYRRACRTIDERLSPTDQPENWNTLSWMCCLAANDVEPGRLVQLMDKAVAAAPKEYAFLNTRGIVLYRAGRYEDAVRQLTESIEAHGKGGTFEDWVFLAMAEFRLDHVEKARKAFKRAIADYDEKITPTDLDHFPEPWYVRVEWQQVRKEAEELLPK